MDGFIAELDSRGLRFIATCLMHTKEELFTVTWLKDQRIAPELVMVATSAVDREFRKVGAAFSCLPFPL